MPKRHEWAKMKLNVSYIYKDRRSITVEENKAYGPIILHCLRVSLMA